MKKNYDVVIVGMGVAGLYAALHFPSDINVLIISKKNAELSNSSLAQGGVAAVLDQAQDNIRLHAKDTLIAGKYKNNAQALEVLVREGPIDVLHLKDMGVKFDTNFQGDLQLTLEAGHSRNRIAHHKDSTGKAITDFLIAAVKKQKNIDIAENTLVYSIDKTDNGFYLNLLQGKNTAQIGANYCLLATGGIGRVYKYTTNCAIATGDGIMLAQRLGANINYLSRIQIHPTAFAAEPDRERFLISEAVRGEGAVLLNCNNKQFAFQYDERGELAPRDVVSNAIILESQKTNSENFYLDITHKDANFLQERFPMIYARCLEENIDITKDKIPVFPCQHYLMGGIDVDLNAKSSIDRLYAAGECSHTGVHGANRLASNSLLEALVFSRRAARDITCRIQSESQKPLGSSPLPTAIEGEPLPRGIRTEIRSIMQACYFVIPRPELFPKSLKRITEILDDLEQTSYQLTVDYIEAKSLATIAKQILLELTAAENNIPREGDKTND